MTQPSLERQYARRRQRNASDDDPAYRVSRIKTREVECQIFDILEDLDVVREDAAREMLRDEQLRLVH